MSKKKDLKHTINCICGDLFAEVVAISLYGSQQPTDAVHDLLSAVIVMRNDYVKRISHPEPGISPKAYYKKLVEDFNRQATEIVDQISNLG